MDSWLACKVLYNKAPMLVRRVNGVWKDLRLLHLW